MKHFSLMLLTFGLAVGLSETTAVQPAPHVVLLCAKDGRPIGSGVVIADGVVLTAKHVQPVVSCGGKIIKSRRDHPKLDLSVLIVPGIKGSATFGPTPHLFDKLSAYGYHRGRLLMRTDGYQSDTYGWFSAPVVFGCSGGAVVAQGRLVGIITQMGAVWLPDGNRVPVFHMAGYTVLSPEVIKWIKKK